MTTFATLVSSVAAISITGVETEYTYEPYSLSDADLPAQFPRLPNGSIAAAPADCTEIGETKVVDLVICLQPVQHGTAEANFDATIAMLDYANTAVRTWKFATAQNGLKITYTLATSRDAPVYVGDTAYYAVIASIQAEG